MDCDGEYRRRKWDMEEPPIPAPMMQTVGGGMDGEGEEGKARARRVRRKSERSGGGDDVGGATIVMSVKG